MAIRAGAGYPMSGLPDIGTLEVRKLGCSRLAITAHDRESRGVLGHPAWSGLSGDRCWMRGVENQDVEFVHATRNRPQGGHRSQHGSTSKLMRSFQGYNST